MPLVAEKTLTDEQLVRQTLQGDDHAFTEIVRRHKGWVLAHAAKFCRNIHDADDLAQNIFIKAYKKLATYRGESHFKHWLSRIAARCALDHLRWHRARRWLVFLPPNPDDQETASLPEPIAQQPQEPDPMLPRLRAVLQSLPPQDRLLITLLEAEDRTVEEVASLLGWSQANVKTRAHRVRAKIKQNLTRRLGVQYENE